MVYLWLIAVSQIMKYDFEPGKRRPQVNAASEMLEQETPRLQVNKVLFKSLRTQSSLASRDIPAFEIRAISRPRPSLCTKRPRKDWSC